ncbi:hypothetical protein ACH4TV_31620 [Streptomyces sp. NPDC020898]|uniref:hypothetical protein n=1 Tax=Streptomyces sp. NPDC020898 TaxID=3365101 RepID=UPI0037A1C9BD
MELPASGELLVELRQRRCSTSNTGSVPTTIHTAMSALPTYAQVTIFAMLVGALAELGLDDHLPALLVAGGEARAQPASPAGNVPRASWKSR